MSNAGEEEQGSRSENRVENKQELELYEYAEENSDVKYCDEQKYKAKRVMNMGPSARTRRRRPESGQRPRSRAGGPVQG